MCASAVRAPSQTVQYRQTRLGSRAEGRPRVDREQMYTSLHALQSRHRMALILIFWAVAFCELVCEMCVGFKRTRAFVASAPP